MFILSLITNWGRNGFNLKLIVYYNITIIICIVNLVNYADANIGLKMKNLQIIKSMYMFNGPMV